MSCSTDTSKGHNKCLVKFDSYGELINYYNGNKENPSFFEKISPYLSIISDYTNIFDPSFFNKFEPFDRLDTFISNPEFNNNKKTGYPVVDRLLLKGNDLEEKEDGKLYHKIKGQTFTVYGKEWLKCIATALEPFDFEPDCDWEKDSKRPYKVGKKTMLPHVPDPNKKTRDVITAIEVVTYPENSVLIHAGCIAKITGIYYADIFDVADKTKWNALVDGKINGDAPHYLDRFINPKERKSDITLAYDEVIGHQIEKTEVFSKTMDGDMKGIDVSLKNEYLQRKLLIVDNTDDGYALTGIKYYTVGDGDTPISEIECKFSSFYTRHLPDQYPDKYVSLSNGIVRQEKLQNQNNAYEIKCEDNEYIQSLMFMYSPIQDYSSQNPFDDPFISQLFGSVISFFKGKTIEGIRWPSNLGVMGILASMKLKIINYNDMVEWINKTNNVRTCDMTQETIYGNDTIEYSYAKGILKQYLSLGYPSDRCKVVLTDYCNKVGKIDEEDEFVSGGYIENVNMVENKIITGGSVEDEVNDVDVPNGILLSPNKKFALVQTVNGLLVIYKFKNPIVSINDIDKPTTVKEVIWSSIPFVVSSQPSSFNLILTRDGELITVNSNNEIIWSSNSQKDERYSLNYDLKEAPYSLKMTNKGGLYIYDKSDEIIWSSQTQPTYMDASNIGKKLCGNFCELKDSNCDGGINTYCSKSKYLMNVGVRPFFTPSYIIDISGNNYYRKPGQGFRTLVRAILNDPSYNNLKIPNIKELYTDNICACKVDYSDDMTGNIDKIREFYQRLLNLYTEEKINVADNDLYPNKSVDSIIELKELLIMDMETLREFLRRIELYYPMIAYDKVLSLKLTPQSYENIKVKGKIRPYCSFPWCAKSSYKTYTSKQDNEECNNDETCLGRGYSMFSINENNGSINCNLQVGANANCTEPMEPKSMIMTDPKRLSQCRTILNPDFESKIENVPNYCQLDNAADALNSRGSWECKNITREDLSSINLKDISDLLVPKPDNIENVDLSSINLEGIKYYYAKRGTHIPEFPTGGEGLCPPPWDNKTYIRTPYRCDKAKDCNIIGEKITSPVCELDKYALETDNLKGKRKIKYEVIPESGNGITCQEKAQNNINSDIEWSEETSNNKKYVYGYEKCLYVPSSSSFFNSRNFKIISGISVIFLLVIIFLMIYKKRK